jgi:sugar-specific transcriptional regulator TrmB
MFLDFLLLIMIVICVVYCWMLNRRIQDLQNSRVEFARMIKELNLSIIKAESNIHEMTQLSQVTSVEIKSVVEEAKEEKAELTGISDVASELSTKLNEQLQLALQVMESIRTSTVNQNNTSSSERFTDDDLPDLQEGDTTSYTDQLKSFIQGIVKNKSEESSSLTQMNYYDTLRKINVKK